MSLSKGRPAIASHDPRRDANTIERERHASTHRKWRTCAPLPRVHTTAPHPSPRRASGSRLRRFPTSPVLRTVWVVCAPQQGACKLTLNVKDGIIEEALVETIGCSGMTHSAAMASGDLPGKTILEALNTDLVATPSTLLCARSFLQIVYGRSQTAFSEGGLPVGASLDDLGKGLRSQVGTMFRHQGQGARYLELAQGLRHPHGSQRQERDKSHSEFPEPR